MNSIKKRYTVVGLNVEDNAIFDSEALAFEYIQQQYAGRKYMIQPTYESIMPQDNKFRVSICMPIWDRPQRTLRAINSVFNQNINGWQLVLIGDGCPKFQQLLDSGYIDKIKVQAIQSGNEVIALNLDKNYGGYGYYARNTFRTLATGEYTIYLDNDDVLKENHLVKYLSGIEKTDFDFCFYDTWIEPINWHREAALAQGKIGHSEVIIKTSSLLRCPEETTEYGHDYTQIQRMVDSGAKYKKWDGAPYTYIVKSMPNALEQGID